MEPEYHKMKETCYLEGRLTKLEWQMNDYHREKFLMIAKESNYHNASIGSRYMEGVRGDFQIV